jgi:hypothetical protein
MLTLHVVEDAVAGLGDDRIPEGPVGIALHYTLDGRVADDTNAECIGDEHGGCRAHPTRPQVRAGLVMPAREALKARHVITRAVVGVSWGGTATALESRDIVARSREHP